jgi:hypothetical protein
MCSAAVLPGRSAHAVAAGTQLILHVRAVFGTSIVVVVVVGGERCMCGAMCAVRSFFSGGRDMFVVGNASRWIDARHIVLQEIKSVRFPRSMILHIEMAETTHASPTTK